MKIELSFIRGDPNEQKRAIHHPMRKYKILAQEIQINTEKMAEICHISVSSLRKIERNELPPRLSVDIIFYLVFYFKLVPKQLFYSLLELENN
jgi:hypothetical protein